jgi:hypothetical protein
MPCYICQAEAVTRCYTCGELVCAQHGKNDSCQHCNSGIAAGDPRHSHITDGPLGKPEQQPAWWRPQEAEEFQPPACYECKGLTRAVCRNCHSNYCKEHAGPNGLCQACGRSANLGLYVVLGMIALLLLMFACNWLFR